MRRRAGDVAPVDADRPAVGHEARDGIDEGRLAGAVRADQADELAGLDVEADVDDGSHAPNETEMDRAGEHRGHGSAAIAEGWAGTRLSSVRSAAAAAALFLFSNHLR